MADFISTLTGQEMDAALSDMAMHTSEAYAVGTRNGSVVTSGDPTYHNNAKYYAEVAASVIPGTVTEAVRWDTPQALTNAQQAQARENIGAMAATTSGVNLLDNPFYTVNQRSASNITGSSSGTPSVDRWLLFGSGSTTDLTVTSNGVSVHSATNGFAQRMPSELADYLDGKTVTLSVMDTSGEVASGSLVYDKTTLKNTGSLTIGSYTCALYAGKSGSNQIFSITTGANTIPLRAVKLELGTVSTLANDAPPDYGAELAKCQRYFVRVPLSTGQACATGFANSTTSIRFLIPVPSTMRSAPSISLTGSCVANGNGSQLTVSGFNSYAVLATCGVACACTVSGATQYQAYSLSSTDTTSHIDLSADL